MKITTKRLKEIIMEEMEAAYQRDPEPESPATRKESGSPATTIAHALDELLPDLHKKDGVVSVFELQEKTGLSVEEIVQALEGGDDMDSIELQAYASLAIEVQQGGASVS